MKFTSWRFTWVVVTRGLRMVSILLNPFRALITLLIPTHEPPSSDVEARVLCSRVSGFGLLLRLRGGV